MNQTELFQQFSTLQNPPMTTFYNTIHLKGKELERAQVRASGQTEKILKFFRQHPRTWFTPWAVHLHLGQQELITSVRRSITTLTDAGYLVRSEEKVKERAGASNYQWKLKSTN